MNGKLGDRCRAVPREPCRGCAAAGHHDLEGPLPEREFGLVVAGVAEVVGKQAVVLVAFPVEFFLKRDHDAAKRLGHALGKFQFLGQGNGRLPILEDRIGQTLSDGVGRAIQLLGQEQRLRFGNGEAL